MSDSGGSKWALLGAIAALGVALGRRRSRGERPSA
jgi:MYXO-CTERM domain-containing protein